jgi:hypothetical protein
MKSLLIEVILNPSELAAQGFGGRDEVEEILEDALVKNNLGEITGGGTGMGISMIDVEIADENRIDEVLEIIRKTLLNSNLSARLEVRR